MKRYRLAFEWMVFISAVDNGGLSSAARKMNCSVSLVSKCISKLEQEFNTHLIRRSARDFEITTVGKKAYKKAVQLRESFDELANDIDNVTKGVGGVINVSVPAAICNDVMNEWIFDFSKDNPGVCVFLNAREVGAFSAGSPGIDDIVMRSGRLDVSDLIHKKINPISFGMYVSPSYLSGKVTINKPEDLCCHPIIKLEHHIIPCKLSLFNNGIGAEVSIKENILLSSNSVTSVLQLTVKGHGVCVALPNWVAQPYVSSGQLIQILPMYTLPKLDYYLIWRYRKQYSFYFRALLENLERKWNNLCQ